MLSVLTQSIANASFGIYFPKFVGTIYELLSAPISYFEIVLGYVGAAATKSIILGLIILATAGLFVPLHIHHPVWMLTFLVLTAVTFSLFGFIIGIWADGFEKLQMIPMLVVTPLTFLGGSFYSVNMLPSGWRTITLAQSRGLSDRGFRWSFYEIADVSVGTEPRHDDRLPRHLHDRGVVDLQDRVPAEELTQRRQPDEPAHPGIPDNLRISLRSSGHSDHGSSGNGRSCCNSRGSDGRDASRRWEFQARL